MLWMWTISEAILWNMLGYSLSVFAHPKSTDDKPIPQYPRAAVQQEC